MPTFYNGKHIPLVIVQPTAHDKPIHYYWDGEKYVLVPVVHTLPDGTVVAGEGA